MMKLLISRLSLLAAIVGINTAAAFQINHPAALHQLSSVVSLTTFHRRPIRPFVTSQSSSGNILSASNNEKGAPPSSPVPFFASFLDSVLPGSSTTSSSSSPITTTTRLPLGTIFDSRDYIFEVATNVRGYEWTQKEAVDNGLLDDLIDASPIGFNSQLLKKKAETNTLTEEEQLAAMLLRNNDFELGQIVLVPMEWDRDLFGLGSRYDVYDGQQRLVTLCLLFAALRQSFVQDENNAENDDVVSELHRFLNPSRSRKEDVTRMKLRPRDDQMLNKILMAKDTRDILLVESTTQEKDTINVRSSLANERVAENYSRLLRRLNDYSNSDRLTLLDYILEHVHLMACIPESGDIARNLVLGQGKGMNNESIDDFKGLVCFRYTADEDDMYSIFDSWDELASQPVEDGVASLSSGGVGRNIISAACLLRAASTLQTRISKQNQLLMMERWLRQTILTRGGDGKLFFEQEIRSASLVLASYREGKFNSFTQEKSQEEKAATKGATAATTGEMIETRLSFLRQLTQTVSVAKDLEMVVLELLLQRSRVKVADGKDASPTLTLQQLDGYLRQIELLAMWFVLKKPSPMKRYQRCLEFMSTIRDGNGVSNVLTEEEKQILSQRVVVHDFGKNPAERKIALALLERLNAHIVLTENGRNAAAGATNSIEYYVEHVLPPPELTSKAKRLAKEWVDFEEKEKWVHRLGNLVLVSQKPTVGAKKSAFQMKKQRYENEVESLPLTRGLTNMETWDNDALMKHLTDMFTLFENAWEL
mmetsp:Transcript_23976/g.29440  ORF Transcript_23976/g.29440 Transcript_23976/m.29440 type:complete len:764 (-) Transcript_23976:95-2386(-)